MTTPTLLEASQALLKAAKQSVEWRLTGIGRPPEQLMQLEIEALEQAIGLEPRPKFTRFDVLVIITAYEQGYGKGLQDQGVPNGYAQHSPASQAWDLGYEEGQMRLKQQNREPKP